MHDLYVGAMPYSNDDFCSSTEAESN